jgi:hypothetical protein
MHKVKERYEESVGAVLSYMPSSAAVTSRAKSNNANNILFLLLSKRRLEFCKRS